MTTNCKEITRLVPIFGKWDVNAPDASIYNGPQPEFDKPLGICVSDVRFVEGETRVTIKFLEGDGDIHGRLLIGYRSPDAPYLSVGIGRGGFAYSLYQFEIGTGWRPLVLLGAGVNISSGKPYDISVHVQGQRLVFKQDNIPVFEHLLQSPLPVGQLGLFAWGHGRVEFTKFCAQQEYGSAFVVMQFAEPYVGLYKEVIKQVVECDMFKLKAYCAGDTFGRVILQDIIRGLEEARVVIAEITPANKNVFYELGYAHALKKPTIF